MKHLDKEALKAILPHREPMLLVDETEYDDTIARSKYHIKEDEFFIQGHFPGNPIVPGVILCEIMAQGTALVAEQYIDGKLALYAGIDNAKFKETVRPGDVVETMGKLDMVRLPLIKVKAEARVNGKICCKADLSFILVDKNI